MIRNIALIVLLVGATLSSLRLASAYIVAHSLFNAENKHLAFSVINTGVIVLPIPIYISLMIVLREPSGTAELVVTGVVGLIVYIAMFLISLLIMGYKKG